MPGHDQLFKDLFRTFFPELLLLVDPDLAANLTAGTGLRGLTFLDKEVFLDWPEGRRREADLVAEVPDHRGKRKLLVHVEIEHPYRREIGRRIWRYSTQLDLRYGVPVVSIVVFLRGGPPGARWFDHVEPVADRPIHRFSYVTLGLSRIPAQTLLERPEPLAWALAALARPGKLGRARLKLELLRKIATAHVNQIERFLLTNCVETYLQLTGRAAEQYASLYAAQANPEVEVMRMTWADRMEAEYRQKGLAQGREEGLAQGLEEGLEKGLEKGLKKGLKKGLEKGIEQGLERGIQKGIEKGIETGIERGIERGIEKGIAKGVERLRQTLLRLLGKRFGEVSPAVRERVGAIGSLDELGGLIDRILEVKSIEELGLGS